MMLGGAALAGLAFVHRPWPNRLDVLGYRLLPASFDARWAHDLATLGSLTALVIGVIAIFLVGVVRDWVRAVACAVAPVVAVLIVQDLAKPLVGRHIGIAGGSSYPSGTVAAVAALATGATLVMPRVIRPLMAAVGVAATIGTSLAVVVLRWHYPTDALGGIAVGIGAVLVLDGILHVPWAIASAFRGARHQQTMGVQSRPRLA
jgi:membrane-associated phospholipid phosphatase